MAYEGQDLQLTCYSRKKPCWKKNGVIIKPNFVTKNTIRIEKVSHRDSGVYTCSVREFPRFKMIKAKAEVYVGCKHLV